MGFCEPLPGLTEYEAWRILLSGIGSWVEEIQKAAANFGVARFLKKLKRGARFPQACESFYFADAIHCKSDFKHTTRQPSGVSGVWT